MRLSRAQKAILLTMSHGGLLRSHRDIDGNKPFLLHLGPGQSMAVKPSDVRRLRESGLIDSNKKFPVATFWLTEAGSSYLAAESTVT